MPNGKKIQNVEEIRLTNISKRFKDRQVLHNFSALLPQGKTSCLMAPSGAGKTTLLRILMGLESLDAGTIAGLEGLKKSAIFQEDRLCDYLSPRDNIRLVSPSLPIPKVMDALRSVGLQGWEHHPCRDLSGGMRRRVALLRALMADYDILFLDEPFKGLDGATKELVIGDTLRRCQGRTLLLVTHDRAEAEAMSAIQIISL